MNRVAWITGASSGIGAALARELAGAGWQVAATARNEGALAALAADAEALPGLIRGFPADVTDAGALVDAVARIEADLGPIALAVLNAGTHRPMAARDFDAEAFAGLVEVNLVGTARALGAVMPAMIRRGAGQIAVVASVAGYRGLPTAVAYGATKAGLINMTEALRFGLHGTGVRIHVVNPGFVRTPLTDRNPFPMPFLIEPEEAARRIRRGLEGSAFEIAFPRRFVAILKLLRLLPHRLYFPLVRWTTTR